MGEQANEQSGGGKWLNFNIKSSPELKNYEGENYLPRMTLNDNPDTEVKVDGDTITLTDKEDR